MSESEYYEGGEEGEDPPPEDSGGDGAEKPEGEEGEAGEAGIGERIVKDPIELGFLVPLPIKLEFDNIPRINDSRSVWR